MAYASYPGLEDVIRKIGRDYGLPLSATLGERRVRGIYQTPIHEKIGAAVKMLDELQPGLWLWVVHLGIDSPEQDALVHSRPEDRFPPEGVGKHRAAELRAILSREVRDAISRRGIELTSYRELWKEMNK